MNRESDIALAYISRQLGISTAKARRMGPVRLTARQREIIQRGIADGLADAEIVNTLLFG